MKLNIGMIGCGYWGPNLLRNFYENKQVNVAAVADLQQDRLDYVGTKYPDIKLTSDFQTVFNSPEIDAVVIATPARTHFELARRALESNKHVLVEKPLAMNSQEAFELVQLAKKNDLRLMVGHTFEFNAAVIELKKQLAAGNLGAPYYIYAQRLNLGIVRQDINALWNLAPHDISILIYLLGQMPTSVSAQGFSFLQNDIEDVAFVILNFPNDVIAHLQVSWLDPSKVRRMTIVGSEKMVIYDDVGENKIQIYDKGIKKQNIDESLGSFDDFGKFQLIKHAGDVSFPKIEFTEPLAAETSEFVNAILQKRNPKTDGVNGYHVVQVLEAAQQSIKNNGQTVNIVHHEELVQQSNIIA